MEVKTCSIYCGLPKATKKESKKKGINNCGNRRKKWGLRMFWAKTGSRKSHMLLPLRYFPKDTCKIGGNLKLISN